jgi:hypothetical protein
VAAAVEALAEYGTVHRHADKTASECIATRSSDGDSNRNSSSSNSLISISNSSDINSGSSSNYGSGSGSGSSMIRNRNLSGLVLRFGVLDSRLADTFCATFEQQLEGERVWEEVD